MKKILYFFFALVLVVSTYSCEDKEEASGKIKQISRIQNNDQEEQMFLYDSQNRMIRYIYKKMDEGKNKGKIYDYDSLVYNNDGKLAVVISKLAITTQRVFSYNGDTIFVSPSVGDERDTLIINNKGFLIKQTNVNGLESENIEYIYDSNNNIIETKISSSKDGNYSLTATYDNMKNIYSNQNLPAWFWAYREVWYTGANNPIKYYTNSGILDDEVIYVYDSEGYPARATFKDSEGNIKESQTSIYYYRSAN